jgi:hypothetical protein
VLHWNGARGPGSPLARSRGRKLGTRGRKASQQQLVNAGKASAARADEFARDVRLLIGGALKATHGNYTQAAAQLNEDGYRSAEGKLWGRRSVAAVVRRLQREADALPPYGQSLSTRAIALAPARAEQLADV